jgi:hypothetical protein
MTGDDIGTDEAYHQSITANEYADVAALGRTVLTRIAQRTFRAATPAVERSDAFTYCLSALRTFASLTPAEVADGVHPHEEMLPMKARRGVHLVAQAGPVPSARLPMACLQTTQLPEMLADLHL